MILEKPCFYKEPLKEKDHLNISIVIPVYNEEESLGILYKELTVVLENIGSSFEIIFINDGSTDGSLEIMNRIHEEDPRVKVIDFKYNLGKAKALAEGFKAVGGQIVFTMDADLQDDPQEIPNFLKKIEEGHDLVSGWKKKRHDPLEKRLPSKLFNRVTSLMTGLKLHDFNCGFKAYKREILDEIMLYGELHRYIPALAHWQGYTVGEIQVQHHARKFGKSKYGWERYFRGFFDLFTVILLTRFKQTPLYLFGLTGLFMTISSIIILIFLTSLQFMHGSILGHKPLSYLGVLSVLFGSQLIATGLIAEMLNYLRTRKRQTFSIKKMLSNTQETDGIKVSIIIPLHNERASLATLFERIKFSLGGYEDPYEIIFIDDGSTDGTFELLKEFLNSSNQAMKIVQLRRQFGKTLALQAGFNIACGGIIVTMDGDLQNDPEEITRLLIELNQSVAMVLGLRTGVPFPRSLFSRIFNWVVSCITGVKIHDINCGLKAFRKEVLDNIDLHGEFHRFFPLLVAKNGFNIVEIPVSHKERHYGKSKYGPSRIPKAFLDLLAIVLLTDFRARPLHLFGSVGIAIGTIGFFINLYLTVLKLRIGNMGDHYTLLLMGVTLMILGLQWFSTGLLGELVNKLRHS